MAIKLIGLTVTHTGNPYTVWINPEHVSFLREQEMPNRGLQTEVSMSNGAGFIVIQSIEVVRLAVIRKI